MNRVIGRIVRGPLPALSLFIMLLGSLYLLSEATQHSEQFSQLYVGLLALNTLILLILLLLIAASLIRLVRRYRQRAPGSRLTVRMVVMFVILSVTPVTVVYLFSVQFLLRGIDSWFNVQVETALDDALELSRNSLDARMRELLHATLGMAQGVDKLSETLLVLQLDELRVDAGAHEVTLMEQNGHIIASSSSDPTRIIPYRPDETILSQVRSAGPYVGLDTLSGLLYIRAVVPVTGAAPGFGGRVLQVIYPVAARLDRLASNVQDAYGHYQELAFLREPLKFSFIITLSLVLMLSLLSAVLAAFASARRLVAPIGELAEGTRAVAAGDYDKRLPELGGDELGVLVRSFNEMTRRIAQARDAAHHSQQEAESQHAYLEAVLGRLTSGVLVFDSAQSVRTVNATARQILRLEQEQISDTTLAGLGELQSGLEPFIEVLQDHIEQEKAGEWREEVTLFSGGRRQVLMCRGTTLSGDARGGHIVVFDDITNLVQAQRDAAWGEVARRLAHEIKNPLTPIQLSAERLRHKFLARMDEKDAAVLDRSTHTIVQQVEAMKEMVNAFSDYARAPQIQLQPLDLNQLIGDVLELYRGPGSGVEIENCLEAGLPNIEADSGRLRQLMHNLVKNAIEALSGCDQTECRVTVCTACLRQENCRFIELRVEDNGDGFPEELIGQLFEPYVTTKSKGTGLGLAIVKKIVEEHGGMIWGENIEPHGAAIVIRLPVLGEEPASV